MFAAVLDSLPERVNVLPTENYYYVRFVHKGVRYVGNIRLAAADRDQGKVHFSFSEEPTDWNGEPADRHGALGPGEGVSVQKVAALEYRVSAGGRSVTFALNDLSRAVPPADHLAADETFLGPVFDESGIRFFFVFNTRLKVFHFLLDETEPVADELFPSPASSRIVIGKRTGFAFYLWDKRKVLIGVHERQSRLNTSLDGPFDQLPENFIDGDALRDAIVASEPGAKGKIDRFGNFADGTGAVSDSSVHALSRAGGSCGVFPLHVVARGSPCRPCALLRDRRSGGAAAQPASQGHEEPLKRR